MSTNADGRTKADRLHFLIVNGVTGINLVLGLLAVLSVASDKLIWAAGFLLVCAVMDGFDGPLARRWHVSSDFGAQFDSLADMSSFIIGGGALVFFWANPVSTQVPIASALLASGVYVLAGAIRLARYNSAAPARPGYFQGMPTTFVSSFVALSLLLQPGLPSRRVILLVLVLSVLMVSLFPYPKLSVVAPRVPKLSYVLLLAAAAVNLPLTIWGATGLYACSGPLISAKGRYSARAR